MYVIVFLYQLRDIRSTTQLRAKIDELLPQRFDWGIVKFTNEMDIYDIPAIVSAAVLHLTVLSQKAELDQFAEGTHLFIKSFVTLGVRIYVCSFTSPSVLHE